MSKKYEEISNKEYRQREGVSASDLKQMAKSMAHYKYYKENPADSDSPAFLFGRATHKMILEPYDFDNEFAVAPMVDRRTKEGKEAYAKFVSESAGKDVITQETYEQLLAMRDALYATPFCKKLIDGEHEKSFFWEENGLVMKCRPDSFCKIGDKYVCVDYKTAENAETEAFMKSAISYLYDVQSAHYLEGLKRTYGKDFEFIFVIQEKKPPFAANIVQADEYFIQSGRQLRESLLEDYKECLERGEWKGYMGFSDEAQINSLSVPSWVMKTLEVVEDAE